MSLISLKNFIQIIDITKLALVSHKFYLSQGVIIEVMQKSIHDFTLFCCKVIKEKTDAGFCNN